MWKGHIILVAILNLVPVSKMLMDTMILWKQTPKAIYIPHAKSLDYILMVFLYQPKYHVFNNKIKITKFVQGAITS